MKINTVQFNIPHACCEDLPNPNKPMFAINGTPIEFVTYVGFSIEAGKTDMCEVTVRFHAQVEGEIALDGDEFLHIERKISNAPRKMVAGDL